LELIELNTTERKTRGKNAANVLRQVSKIPAVLYGPGSEPISLSVDIKELELILKKHKISQVLLSLKINNGQTSTRSAMIKELQVHPISQLYLHVDFYEIDMNRKIRVKVPVVTKGTPIGVEMGGTLQLIRRELDVFCLPNVIPETIELDVTRLSIGDSIHVKDISLQGDVEIPTEVNFTILTVSSPKAEVAEEEKEAEELLGEEETETESTEEEST